MLPPTAGAVHTSGPAERELVTTSHTHYNLHHMMTFMMLGVTMRTTVTLNDDLIASAQELTGITERTELLREGLETLVRVESARRLAALGGSDAEASVSPRRRNDPW